jgi:hypothetical protein
MTQLANPQTVGLQLEKVRDKAYLLYERDDMLFGRIKKLDQDKVSSRPERVPVQVLAGGNLLQFSPDGGDMQQGTGTTWDFGTLSQVYLAFGVQITALADWATDGKEKAIEDVPSAEVENSMAQFNKAIDNLLNTDGSATFDTVVGTSGTNILTVNNANQFFDNEIIQVIPALGSAPRAGSPVQILSVDPNAKQLYLTGPFPGGTTAGDLLVMQGAPGTAASSVLGLEYFQTQANTGSWLNLARSSYPGKLRTPYVNGNGGSVTPQIVRRMFSQLEIAVGMEVADREDLLFYMGLDMRASWENSTLAISQVFANEVKGNDTFDLLKKNAPGTMGGRKTMYSLHAKPQRIDGLLLKYWFRAESRALDFYNVKGQTTFPVYGASGGLAASSIFYLVAGFNIANANPRAGVYSDSFAAVSGY